MAYLHWATCHNINRLNMRIECPILFQNNNNMYFELLNIGIRGSTSFALNSDQNGHM
jgi:hypothetical protein